MKTLGFIIFPDFNLLDFAGPLTAFDTVSRDLPKPLYQCQTLSVSDLADVACLSLRQFGRLFRSETGQTPAKIIEQLRVEAARERIEKGHGTLETIARQVGFIDPERMRRAFIRLTGQPPQGIRRLAQREN